jgi:hypothetical protein
MAIGVCLGLGLAIPRVGRLATPLLASAIGALYVGILVATRELRAVDLSMLRAIGAKRAR